MNLYIYLRKLRTLILLLYYRVLFPFYKHNGTPNVLSIETTLNLIIEKKLSVSRFGDGEFFHLCGINTGLQKTDIILQNKLKETIMSRNPKLLVCLVDFLDQKNQTTRTKLSASYFYVRLYKKIKKYLDANYYYGNANMTRFYIKTVDKSRCSLYFNLCKQIWEGDDVVIFEGDKTRFGVMNDLLDNAASIRRVLCPSKHAFIYYDQMIAKAKTFDNKCLLFFSLGITATVAANELTNEGYRVIDIGNLDVEYEWYKLGVTKKVGIKGKQVCEVVGGCIVDEITDEKYFSQIVGKIGIEE